MGFAVLGVGRVPLLLAISKAFKFGFCWIVGVDKLLSEIVEVQRLDIEVKKIVAMEKSDIMKTKTMWASSPAIYITFNLT